MLKSIEFENKSVTLGIQKLPKGQPWYTYAFLDVNIKKDNSLFAVRCFSFILISLISLYRKPHVGLFFTLFNISLSISIIYKRS